MVSVGPGIRRLVVFSFWLWLGTACFSSLGLLRADAQVSSAQAGTEGGSLGGAIPSIHKGSKPWLPPGVVDERRSSPRLARRSGDGLAKFDGTWSVSSGGGCQTAGTGQVTIAQGRIIAANGNGRVGPDGSVSTVSTVAGMTIVGQGRIVGNAASGSYRQSDGCVGPWSAVRL